MVCLTMQMVDDVNDWVEGYEGLVLLVDVDEDDHVDVEMAVMP